MFSNLGVPSSALFIMQLLEAFVFLYLFLLENNFDRKAGGLDPSLRGSAQ